jgi:hypothetical protein
MKKSAAILFLLASIGVMLQGVFQAQASPQLPLCDGLCGSEPSRTVYYKYRDQGWTLSDTSCYDDYLGWTTCGLWWCGGD